MFREDLKEFFLFSDVLIYAKRNLLHEYKPHLIMNLEDCSLMEIDEKDEPNALCVCDGRELHVDYFESEASVFAV